MRLREEIWQDYLRHVLKRNVGRKCLVQYENPLGFCCLGVGEITHEEDHMGKERYGIDDKGKQFIAIISNKRVARVIDCLTNRTLFQHRGNLHRWNHSFEEEPNRIYAESLWQRGIVPRWATQYKGKPAETDSNLREIIRL